MSKRWIILGLVGAGLLFSYILLPGPLFQMFYSPSNYHLGSYVYLGWLIFTGVLYLAIIGATRPKSKADSQEREIITHSKEIINKKEVIVKVRCQYCNKVYDETLDNCPFCGGTR